MFSLKVIDKNERTVAWARGEEEVNLMVARTYEEGDRIVLEISKEGEYAWVQFDDALGRNLVYLTGNAQYQIPFGEKRINLSPKAFSGNKHLISVRKARDFEVKSYRNLALNVNDTHENTTCFPHAFANVETRGESVFAAKNAIDGVTANECHGEWPYDSWGINRNPDAEMTVDFGREVEIDRIILYIRADFPHDNWWKKATVTFSDGSTMELELKKTGEAQEFTFEKKKIEWLQIGELIKSEEPSPFPALVQLEVYATEA